MRVPNNGGLSLWLFILVILLSTMALALVAFGVWRKCIKRSKRMKPSPISELEPSACRMYVRKGQIAPSPWASPAAQRNDYEPNSEQSQPQSPQFPEKIYRAGRDNTEKPSYRYSVADLSACKKRSDRSPRRSFYDMLRIHNSATLKRSAGLPSHEVIRASYISDHSIDAIRNVDETDSKRTISHVAPSHLDSAAPSSSVTPLTLPRTPQHCPPHRTAFQLLSKYAPITPLPVPYRLSRYPAGIKSIEKRKERDSRGLCPRRSSSPCDLTVSHGCRPPP